MEHVTLKDKTVLRSPQQAGVKFLELHNATADLKTCKGIIKAHSAIEWFKLGVSLKEQPTRSFSSEDAKALLKKLGATDKQIEGCYRKSTSQFVGVAK
tara:strand:+ start:231 stop:524 length:294 start_codon:yes stop_codon:yes gene_type:complete